MSPLIIAKVATNNLSNLMSQKQICRQIIYGMIYGTFFGSIVPNFNLNLCMLAQNYSIYTYFCINMNCLDYKIKTIQIVDVELFSLYFRKPITVDKWITDHGHQMMAGINLRNLKIWAYVATQSKTTDMCRPDVKTRLFFYDFVYMF